MNNPIVFMDTETLGLDPDAPVWEFAAIRREPDGRETEYHAFFDHELVTAQGSWLDTLDTPFQADYNNRYDARQALYQGERAAMIWAATRGAHVVGAVPSFDTERLAKILKVYGMTPPWHYHLCDIENVVVGYLTAKHGPVAPPWKSDMLSTSLGVDPAQFSRHTAMGDCLWVRAQWDAVMSNA